MERTKWQPRHQCVYMSLILKLGNLWERSVKKFIPFFWGHLFVKARGRVTPQSKAEGHAVILRPEIQESVEASQRYQPESSSAIQHNQRCLCNSFRIPHKKGIIFLTSFPQVSQLQNWTHMFHFPASKLDLECRAIHV